MGYTFPRSASQEVDSWRRLSIVCSVGPIRRQQSDVELAVLLGSLKGKWDTPPRIFHLFHVHRLRWWRSRVFPGAVSAEEQQNIQGFSRPFHQLDKLIPRLSEFLTSPSCSSVCVCNSPLWLYEFFTSFGAQTERRSPTPLCLCMFAASGLQVTCSCVRLYVPVVAGGVAQCVRTSS